MHNLKTQHKKKYIRNYTEEGREKQKNHLNNIRQKAMEKKRELKEITLKAKLMKLEPKIELAKKYDNYVNNKPQIPEPEPEQIVYVLACGARPQIVSRVRDLFYGSPILKSLMIQCIPSTPIER